ncbi:MAG: S1 RNA-binding domain-containing protein [Anaerolineaceae bacterium]
MLVKHYVNELSDSSNPPDEGWWAAVLADEEDHPGGYREKSKTVSLTAVPQVEWERIHQIFEDDEIVTLTVQGYNRGGLLVGGDGIQGFVPISHLVEMPSGMEEEKRRDFLADYVGQTLNLKVIECEPEQERVVFSERAALAGQGRRKDLFNSLTEGQTVQGKVTNITDFGVFVDLGGLEGLIHVSELSWGRVQHPSDLLNVGDEVTALVLQVSEENARVALSIKRLLPNPWDTIGERYMIGDVVSAQITGITRFGAFARLEEGVEGLIHVSSMNLPTGQTDVSRAVWVGEEVSVRILHVDADKRRLGLSMVSAD